MAKKLLFALLLLFLVLFASGCFVSVREDVDYPSGQFASVMERISSLERHNPDRVGRALTMHTLVYDGRERELVKVAIPMWLTRTVLKHNGKSHVRRHQGAAGRYVDLDWGNLEGLSRLGPGLLLQVEDMRENTRVLVWLE